MAQVFEYCALTDPLQIRTVHLQRSENWDAPIVCTLRDHNLQDFTSDKNYLSANTYEAVSYTWGDAGLKSYITVNEAQFQITANLEALLRQRRLSSEDEALWIDAICINQVDDAEKNAQIPLMGRIYALALQVTIWLGPYADNSDVAMRMMHKLGSGSPYHKMPLLSDDMLAAIQALLNRTWWRRIWIVQEIVAGGAFIKLHRLNVLCGNQGIPWMHLVVAAARMHSHREDLRQYFPNIDNILSLESLREGFFDVCSPFAAQNIDCDPSARLLSRFRRFHASNPRDKVYAIHALLGSRLRDSFKPRYDSSVEDVYTALAIQRYHAGDYDFLRHCGLLNYNLPSWVPDWSVSLGVTPLPIHGDEQYSDVPWWAEPPDGPVPSNEIESLESWKHKNPDVAFAIPGYAYRGYQFHGYTEDQQQMQADKEKRCERLRQSTDIEFQKIDKIDDFAKFWGLGSLPQRQRLQIDDLLRSGNVILYVDRNEYTYDQTAWTSTEQQDLHRAPSAQRRGEYITAKREKKKILHSLKSPGSIYSTGNLMSPSFSIVPEQQLLEVQAILWDTIDITHESAFPEDIDEVWQNATYFLVAIGRCKNLAVNHFMATERYSTTPALLEAFWLTIFAGQVGAPDSFDPNDSDMANMAYTEWLPEVPPLWHATTPELTPITSGQLELAQVMLIQEVAFQEVYPNEITRANPVWTNSLDNVDPEELRSPPDRLMNLVPSSWSTEEVALHRREFDRLATLWHEQPYDLYHRPFGLLNTVPDPYWHCRKKYDKAAWRDLREHRIKPLLSWDDVEIPLHERQAMEECINRALDNNLLLNSQKVLRPGFEKYALGRKFFITKKGYFGLGPSHAVAGDRIAVISGLTVPLVIRKHNMDRALPGWKVIGESYVHDTMHGEVSVQWQNGLVERGIIRLR